MLMCNDAYSGKLLREKTFTFFIVSVQSAEVFSSYSALANEKALKCITLGAYCISDVITNVLARKLATPRIVALCVVLSVLAPTLASGSSKHRFGQG